MSNSPNKGKTWQAFNTPITQGLPTTGMYSIDFYDALHGFAIGGDYTKPDDNKDNKIVTNDGGKTWQIVAENENPGYRSCVQYIPNREGKELVAIGFKGIDFSNDGGTSWMPISTQSFHVLKVVPGKRKVILAGSGGRIASLNMD